MRLSLAIVLLPLIIPQLSLAMGKATKGEPKKVEIVGTVEVEITNPIPGPQGEPGLSGYERVNLFSTFQVEFVVINVDCPEGKRVFGGGANLNTADADSLKALKIRSSYPFNDSRWRVRAFWDTSLASKGSTSSCNTPFRC